LQLRNLAQALPPHVPLNNRGRGRGRARGRGRGRGQGHGRGHNLLPPPAPVPPAFLPMPQPVAPPTHLPAAPGFPPMPPPAPLPAPDAVPEGLQPNAHHTFQTHDLGAMDIVCPKCHAFHWLDEQLTSSTRHERKFGMCCLRGKISLAPYHNPPPLLQHLLTSPEPHAKEFREHIRSYNAALAMTSIGVKVDESINTGTGPYVYRIHGALYHRIGSLLPPLPDPNGHPVQPSYAQLYFFDAEQALDFRMARNPMTRADTMRDLQDMLHNINPHVRQFKQGLELLQRTQAASVRLVYLESTDRRRYNLPTGTDMAVILPGAEEDSAPTGPREIILFMRDGGLKRVSEAHPAYEALHYVLMLPFGDLSWERQIPYTEEGMEHMREQRRQRAQRNHDEEEDLEGGQNRVSLRQYHAFRMFPRSGQGNWLFLYGRLLQQYWTDAWVTTEQERLHYIRTHQKTLRAEVYSGLRDAVAQNEHDPHQLGKKFILPSSFTAGSRYMRGLFQDSMAIVRHMGQPDLFITMTANPNWPEISAAIPPHADDKARADIVSRVFALKVKHLEHLLRKRRIFGEIVAHVGTTEFQKRGLPHVHYLFFLAPQHKLRTPEQVDSLISAEIPDRESNPRLYEQVRSSLFVSSYLLTDFLPFLRC
jgi:hypothetical protein